MFASSKTGRERPSTTQHTRGPPIVQGKSVVFQGKAMTGDAPGIACLADKRPHEGCFVERARAEGRAERAEGDGGLGVTGGGDTALFGSFKPEAPAAPRPVTPPTTGPRLLIGLAGSESPHPSQDNPLHVLPRPITNPLGLHRPAPPGITHCTTYQTLLLLPMACSPYLCLPCQRKVDEARRRMRLRHRHRHSILSPVQTCKHTLPCFGYISSRQLTDTVSTLGMATKTDPT